MKQNEIRVLIIEDQEEDVFLIKKRLEKDGFRLFYKNVWTTKTVEQALKSETWDIILSDYSMPAMNGIDALKIRERVKPDTPFIVVTGTIGEEAAVEMLKAGADDYIIKNNMSRLGPAVSQTLKAAVIREEKRAALAELRDTKNMLEGIANGVKDRLLLLTSDFKILWGNKIILDHLQSTLESIRGKTCHETLFGCRLPCQPPQTYCPLRGFLANTDDSSVYTLGQMTFEVKIQPIRFEPEEEIRFIHVSRDITELQDSRAEAIRNLNKQQKLLRGTIDVLSQMMEVRDPYTSGHQRNVSRLASAMAHEMGVAQHRIDGIYLAGIVHDLGKIGIPTEILTKPGKLDKEEYDLIKTHPRVAFDILKNVDYPWPVARAVYEHHERMNGTGYPQGLTGDGICLEARIIAVADVVEAISAFRPYRPALGIGTALEEIKKNRGTLYDESAAEACLSLFNEKGFVFDGKQ